MSENMVLKELEQALDEWSDFLVIKHPSQYDHHMQVAKSHEKSGAGGALSYMSAAGNARNIGEFKTALDSAIRTMTMGGNNERQVTQLRLMLDNVDEAYRIMFQSREKSQRATKKPKSQFSTMLSYQPLHVSYAVERQRLIADCARLQEGKNGLAPDAASAITDAELTRWRVINNYWGP